MIISSGKYYIYRHIRLDSNNPFYIGIGTKPSNFLSIEKEYSRAYSSYTRSNFWNRIVNKYGYKVDILLESNDYHFIKEKEKEFISIYGRINNKSGVLCNLTDGGEGSSGRILSTSTKEKIRSKSIGRKASLETKLKMSENRKGKTVVISENSRKLISLKNKGRIIDGKWREKLLKRRAERRFPVLQYDLDGNFVKEWESAFQIGNTLNIPRNSVSRCCRGLAKSAYNYKWKYKELC